MANTGVTTFAGMAADLRAKYPNKFSEKFLVMLDKLDDLFPYAYDACDTMFNDSSYPDFATLQITSQIQKAALGLNKK